MSNLSRLAQVVSAFEKVYIGDWGGDGDGEVPLWVAMRIRTAAELQAHLVGAVLIVAQGKMLQDKGAAEAHGRLIAELVDDFCGTPPRWPWPWPHILKELGELAERYAAGSMLRGAAFELSQRIVQRAAELGKR
jgi:hypothetical protein